ncbi:unnamed protein product [Protopolystoma xenopodis]|uniref:Uncharacterized protein n=1 Tax=Protopolystoma xenopodis TaxID=117903 RepID=A0A3S5CRG3_9PLAT|nr:unnamed protein product [Protopolystoma xenopodis]
MLEKGVQQFAEVVHADEEVGAPRQRQQDEVERLDCQLAAGTVGALARQPELAERPGREGAQEQEVADQLEEAEVVDGARLSAEETDETAEAEEGHDVEQEPEAAQAAQHMVQRLHEATVGSIEGRRR